MSVVQKVEKIFPTGFHDCKVGYQKLGEPHNPRSSNVEILADPDDKKALEQLQKSIVQQELYITCTNQTSSRIESM